MQISLDVINLGSLISKDWGASYYTSKYKVSPVEIAGYTTDSEGNNLVGKIAVSASEQTLKITIEDENITIEHSYKDAEGNDVVHTCVDVVWTKASTLTGMQTVTDTSYTFSEDTYFYLDEDITLGRQLRTNGHAAGVCLNGKTLTGGTNVRMLGASLSGASATNTAGSWAITTCDANYVEGDTTKNVIKPVGNRFTLKICQNNVVTVGNDNASRFSAAGAVHRTSRVLCVLNETLDGGGIGADQGDDAVHGHHVAVADIDEFHSCILSPVRAVYSIF